MKLMVYSVLVMTGLSGKAFLLFFIKSHDSAHKIYYVKSCLSDAKCFSGSRYSFRVQELKPLLFHNWPVHGEIAWLFPAPC